MDYNLLKSNNSSLGWIDDLNLENKETSLLNQKYVVLQQLERTSALNRRCDRKRGLAIAVTVKVECFCAHQMQRKFSVF